MPLTYITGLLIQSFTVVWMVKRSHRSLLNRCGIVFILVAFMYQGITEILQWLAPGMNRYRPYVTNEALGGWVLTVSIAMLCFSTSYMLTWRSSPHQRYYHRDRLTKPQIMPHRIWLYPISLLAYLVAFSITQKQSVISSTSSVSSEYWIQGLALYTINILLPISIILLIVSGDSIRDTIRWITIMALAVMLLGQRHAIVSYCISVLMGLTYNGVFIPKHKLALLVGISMVLMVTISSGRATVGREALGGNLSSRIDNYALGIKSLAQGSVVQGALGDFIYRFDANSYPSMVYARQAFGVSPAGTRPMVNDILLAIPRFLNPLKVTSDLIDRNSEAYLDAYYQVPTGIDYTTGLFGYLFACFGKMGLWIIAVLLGIAFAYFDNWSLTHLDFTGLLWFTGCVSSVMLYEQNFSAYIMSARTCATIWIFIGFARIFRFTHVQRKPVIINHSSHTDGIR